MNGPTSHFKLGAKSNDRVILALYAIATCIQCQYSSGQELMMVDYENSKGIWQIPMNKRLLAEGDLIITSGNHVFLFDGKYATLLLVTHKNWVYRSPDDIYRLKTKWQGKSLFYLPPFGEWTYLADFDGERFVKSDANHLWKYERISEDGVTGSDKAILKADRAPYDYTILPTDERSNAEDNQ